MLPLKAIDESSIYPTASKKYIQWKYQLSEEE
jgi:hypothetical protein